MYTYLLADRIIGRCRPPGVPVARTCIIQKSVSGGKTSIHIGAVIIIEPPPVHPPTATATAPLALPREENTN